MAINKSIFKQLETEIQQITISIEKLDKTVEEFVYSNGSGEGVRKRLRKNLENTRFIDIVKSGIINTTKHVR